MRLLLAIENAFYGGGERSFAALARGLSARGFEVHVVSSGGNPFSEETAPFAALHGASGPALFDPGYVLRLASVIRGVRPGAVHSQGARMDFYCSLACRLAGVEHISTVAMPVDGFDIGPLRKAAYRFFGGIGEKLTSRFITVSAALRETLAAGHGIEPGLITVIPNCAGSGFFARPARDEALARELGLEGFSVIGASGRLVWQKGFPHLLEAFAGLRRSAGAPAGPLKLLIAGSGEMGDELKKRAAALGISDAVCWAGFREDMPRVLALCDVFALPSLLEGQPIALIEAMAMGLPIAAASLPGTLETAADGAEALLVPPGDAAALGRALGALLEDRALAGRLGAAARRRAENDFTEKIFVEKHAVFYGTD
ncbi:MAG: glycosyltransferase family protein [Elusimicrobia bacterium]|nr:MAG: glycosyltransferase family protein [Elusimicrobiota bacterium]KAF0156993.1 MAG: glycosyltransferase family protein [Elusimicrobiota bacterium]